MLFKRADGVLLTKLPGWRKFFPFLMPTRTESFILHQQPMRMKNGLALLARLNEGRTENRYSLFHIVLAACVRLVAMRPENNRFIIGRRIFQRKEILFAFVTKKEKTEKSAETNVKVSFEREDTLEKVAERTRGNVKEMKKSLHSLRTLSRR